MVKKKVPDTPLPDAGANGEEAHAQMSARFKEHTVIETGIEIENEDRLQASEKIWASVVHALKAAAEQRGWEHDTHTNLSDIAWQLGIEEAQARSSSRGTIERHTRTFSNISTALQQCTPIFMKTGTIGLKLKCPGTRQMC